jgi:soluble lytic murein transglycosylase-like protein
MLSVERPLCGPRLGIVAALLAISALARGALAVGADGLTPPERMEEPPVEAALPVVVVPFDLAAAEAVQIKALIASAAQRRGLDPRLLLGIAQCESGLNPRVTGPGGAAGLFQVIPSTWDWATERLGMVGASPMDPAANVEVAAWLMDTFGPSQWPSC